MYCNFWNDNKFISLFTFCVWVEDKNGSTHNSVNFYNVPSDVGTIVLSILHQRWELLCWVFCIRGGNYCAEYPASEVGTIVLSILHQRWELLCWVSCMRGGNYCAEYPASEVGTIVLSILHQMWELLCWVSCIRCGNYCAGYPASDVGTIVLSILDQMWELLCWVSCIRGGNYCAEYPASNVGTIVLSILHLECLMSIFDVVTFILFIPAGYDHYRIPKRNWFNPQICIKWRSMINSKVHINNFRSFRNLNDKIRKNWTNTVFSATFIYDLCCL